MQTLKRKRLITSVLVVAVPIIGFLIINGILVHQSDREVERRLEAIRAAGDPVTAADFANNVTMEDDAAAMIRPLQEECDRIWNASEDYRCEQALAAGVGGGSDGKWGIVAEYLCPKWPPRPDLSQPAIPDPIPAIREALERKGWSRRIDLSTPSEPAQTWIDQQVAADGGELVRAASRTLGLHMDYRLRRGETSEITEDIERLFRLANMYKDGAPTVLNSLIAMGPRTVAYRHINSLVQNYDVDAESLDRIETLLEECDFVEDLRACIVAERACLITSFRYDFEIGRPWLFRALWNRKLLDDLDTFDALIEDPESIQYLDRDTGQGPYWFQRFLKNYWSVRIRGETVRRALLVLITLKRMQDPASLLRKDGTLDATRLGLSSDVTTDLYSKKPLIVRKMKDGWSIYSVDENLADDGGDVGMTAERGTDVGLVPRFTSD